jgi:hypothetical protein
VVVVVGNLDRQHRLLHGEGHDVEGDPRLAPVQVDKVEPSLA